jgi:hypothetical protein
MEPHFFLYKPHRFGLSSSTRRILDSPSSSLSPAPSTVVKPVEFVGGKIRPWQLFCQPLLSTLPFSIHRYPQRRCRPHHNGILCRIFTFPLQFTRFHSFDQSRLILIRILHIPTTAFDASCGVSSAVVIVSLSTISVSFDIPHAHRITSTIGQLSF